MRWKSHVRFGGRAGETDLPKCRYRAPVRSHYLTKAVDTVRKAENRALVASGDKSLTGTKYLWLHSAENLPERHHERFGILRGGDLKTGRAWAIKESLRWFWDYRGWGEKHFNAWYFWATHS